MEFDNSVAHDNNAHSYNAFCHSIIDQSDENKEENKKFCSKLVRNLGCYATDTKFFNPSTERCNILYYWIYNSIKNKKISNNLVTLCFNDYIGHMTQMRQKPKCYYYHYEDNYNDPMKMIILEIFQYNMKDVNDIVAMEYKQPDFRVQKYICECVKIYKEMNRENCAKSNAANVKSNRTCEKLKTFKKTYENYLFATPHKNYNIPSLDKVEDDYLTMCQTDAPKLALAGQMAEAGSVLQPTTEYRDGKKDEFSPPSLTTDENKGSSMSRTVSTAFGTVAGASSILALLYKVNKEFHLNV
ncbi:hypothetical protein PVMG_04517 [Plasmodium vivax Mauritania I]|uniref:Uncharacterized protein n=2 Tax=Plasmodium vivax TaxID=5855 RepID=A0A0J9T4X5_PLAVI|nr:hypothetical protein PVMG_04517 [Plasmodium vivax Mauritania I]KMZ99333.1 hypothetical protein PVNG_02216 [Plasmodium vivax North Korean]